MHLVVLTCNKAAHKVASFACRACGSFYWDFVPLVWLFNTLTEDANIHIRV